MTLKKKQLYFIGGITWNLAGLRGITRDLAGLRGITRDLAGFGGITRDYAGLRGITRDLAGFGGISGIGGVRCCTPPLRSTIDREFVDASCLNKLFNTLVKPILLNGCKVWAPVLPTVKKVLSTLNKFHNLDHALSHIFQQQLEQVHLRHLKYLLSIINRRAVNATAW